MQYRIVETDDGKYIAQVKDWFLGSWDDLFVAGVAGLVRYSEYKRMFGSHNSRWSDSIKDCQENIEAYKKFLRRENGEDLSPIE